MSEAAEIFPDLKEESRKRRASNRERSTAMLLHLGLEFDAKNDGAHLIIRHNGKTVDFWPGTGKFIPRTPKPKHGRGVFNLLQILGIDPKAAKENEQ